MTDLFPPNYWLEPNALPSLRIVPHFSGEEWTIIRTYVNQEGGTSACVVMRELDPGRAETALGTLHQELARGLKYRAEWKVRQAS